MQIRKSSVNLDLFLLVSMLLVRMQERETRSRLDVVTVPSYLQRGPPADPGGQLQARVPERADSAVASQSLGAAVSRSLSLCCSTVLLVHSQVVTQFTCNRYQNCAHDALYNATITFCSLHCAYIANVRICAMCG